MTISADKWSGNSRTCPTGYATSALPHPSHSHQDKLTFLISADWQKLSHVCWTRGCSRSRCKIKHRKLHLLKLNNHSQRRVTEFEPGNGGPEVQVRHCTWIPWENDHVGSCQSNSSTYVHVNNLHRYRRPCSWKWFHGLQVIKHSFIKTSQLIAIHHSKTAVNSSRKRAQDYYRRGSIWPSTSTTITAGCPSSEDEPH